MTRIIQGGAVYVLSLSLPRFKILSRTHHIFEVITSWYFPYFMYIINQDIFHVYFIDMLSNKTTQSDYEDHDLCLSLHCIRDASRLGWMGMLRVNKECNSSPFPIPEKNDGIPPHPIQKLGRNGWFPSFFGWCTQVCFKRYDDDGSQLQNHL